MSFFKKFLPIIGAALGTMLLPGIGTSIGGSLGGAAGGLSSASNILGGISGLTSILGGNKRKTITNPSPAQSPAFSPSKPTAIARPSSLSDLSGYDPSQERSALATKGMQGGLGKPEQDYYKNLIQRSLIGDTNEVTGDTNSLLPVESQYFSKQGINTSDIMKFLQQLQG